MNFIKRLLLITIVLLLGACAGNQRGGADYFIDYYRCRDTANAITDGKLSYDTFVNCMEKSGWKER